MFVWDFYVSTVFSITWLKIHFQVVELVLLWWTTVSIKMLSQSKQIDFVSSLLSYRAPKFGQFQSQLSLTSSFIIFFVFYSSVTRYGGFRCHFWRSEINRLVISKARHLKIWKNMYHIYSIRIIKNILYTRNIKGIWVIGV